MAISDTSRKSPFRLLATAAMALTLSGCTIFASPEPEAKQQTGSLIRTYTLIDEQGRTSGTLVIGPLGGAELRDADGNLVGKLKPQPSSPSVIVPQQQGKK